MGKPRTSSIPLYDGDDFERITELRRAVDQAQRRALVNEARGEDARAGDDDDPELDVQASKDAYDAFVLEAAERAEIWTVQPIGHRAFRKLLKDHPPRTIEVEDDEAADDGDPGMGTIIDPADAQFGVNTDTFPTALLLYVEEEPEDPDDVDRTVVSPTFPTAKALARRLDRLAEGEFDAIWVRAWQLNRGGAADPKASLYSVASRG